MRAKRLIIIHAFLAALMHAAAAFASGGDAGLLRLAPAASSLGRGACGVSSPGTDLFTANPASIGGLRRWSLHAAYGAWADAADHTLGIALPSAYGVLGLSARYLAVEGEDPSMPAAFQGDIGAAKEIYPGLFLGAALHGTFADIEDGQLAYGAFRAGFLFIAGGAGPRWRGFGFHGLGIGASLRAGAANRDDDAGNLDRAAAGLTAELYRSGIVSVSLAGEGTTEGSMDDIAVKAGIESVMGKMFIARAGWIARDPYGRGRYALGAGLRFDALDIRGDIDYAFLSGGGAGSAHYVGMTVAPGGPDTRPPVISASADCAAFSPNSDGRQDRVYFSLHARDEGDVRGWYFQVLDARGRLVREYRYRGRNRQRGLTPLAIARSMLGTRERGVIPASVDWDGTDDAGRLQGDGEYHYSFAAWDDRDNIAAARKGRVRIDTVAPEVSVTPIVTAVDPTGGAPVEIAIRVRDQNEDRVSVSLLDGDGDEVRGFNWVARGAPTRISWDGKDEEGAPVKPGRYSCLVTVSDGAGNSAVREIRNIVVETGRRRVDLVPDSDYYSPAPGKPLRFGASYEKGLSAGEWKFSILDVGGETVRFLRGEGLPASFEWDGLAGNGKTPRDGVYLCRLEVTPKNGAPLASADKSFVVDSTPPRPRLKANIDSFTPDGDFIDDRIIFRPVSRDVYGTGRWEINIRTEAGASYFRVAGEGEVPERILWDGRGKGPAPFSMERFTAELVTLDRAGNRSRPAVMDFSTGIMFLPDQGALRITLPDRSDASRLRADASFNAMLGELADAMEDYPGHAVEIESHSDFEGDDAANLAATEKKAKYVRDFLARRGIGGGVISFRGMGETRPLFGEDAGADRKKNNRLELVLTPKAE